MRFALSARFLQLRSRHVCAAWLLVVSVMLGLDPPQIFLYLDPQDRVNDVAETVAREACPHLRLEGVPLPVPFEVHWFRKDREGQRHVPDPGRRVEGLLTTCP